MNIRFAVATAIVLFLGNCSEEEVAPPKQAAESKPLITVHYQCPPDYSEKLRDLVAEESLKGGGVVDPFLSIDSPSASDGSLLIDDRFPADLLEDLGFDRKSVSSLFYDTANKIFIVWADRKGHSTFLTLHNQLGLPIYPTIPSASSQK